MGMQELAFWKAVIVDESNFLEAITTVLAENHIRYCVIGGQGVNAYVDPLVSLDLDLVVAAEHAIFGIPEVKRGLVAAGGGLVRLPKRVPRAVALELALTGDSISATRAYELGLVNVVVPADRVLDEALALAGRIIANAPLSVRYSRQITLQSAEVPEAKSWELSDAATAPIFGSADSKEGAIAFAEKRAPNWQGR